MALLCIVLTILLTFTISSVRRIIAEIRNNILVIFFIGTIVANQVPTFSDSGFMRIIKEMKDLGNLDQRRKITDSNIFCEEIVKITK